MQDAGRFPCEMARGLLLRALLVLSEPIMASTATARRYFAPPRREGRFHGRARDQRELGSSCRAWRRQQRLCALRLALWSFAVLRSEDRLCLQAPAWLPFLQVLVLSRLCLAQ